MPDSRGSGLLRYDANTFMPLQHSNRDGHDANGMVGPKHLAGQEVTSTLPRVSANRASYFSTFAANNNNNQDEDAVNGMSVVPLTPTYLAGTTFPPFYNSSAGQQYQAGDKNFADSWTIRLHNNDNIGAHRFAVMLNKMPALIVGSIAAWILFGRGQVDDGVAKQEDVRTQQEFNAALAAFVTSCVVLLAAVLASQNHNYSHKRAYTQSVWRVLMSTINFMFLMATIVLCALALVNLRTKKEPEPPECYPLNCFSRNERIANLGVMLCFTIFLAISSIFCVIFGLQAIFQIERDRKYFKSNSSQKLSSAAFANLIPVTDRY